MPIDQAPLGWIQNDEAVDDFTARLIAQTGAATFAAAQPDLSGHWDRICSRGMTKLLAQDFEEMCLGHNLPAESQRRGTCVSRGTFRAIQDAYFFDISYGDTIGRPAALAFEPIYGGSRVNIGRGQLGNGDGSCGAWAAEFVHTFGVVERDLYGHIDLHQPSEELAVQWGAPGRGVPAAVLAAGKSHTVTCHRVTHVTELADCIAAGYFAAYCSNLIWGDRDKTGLARPTSRGGHCEEIAGVFLLPDGNTAFVRQQSWGQLPNGPDVLHTAGGPVKLRQGSYGACATDLQRGLDEGGECWCFKLNTAFRPETMTEALA